MSEYDDEATIELESLMKRKKELEEDLAWRRPDVEKEAAQVKAWIESEDPEQVAIAITYEPTFKILESILDDREAELKHVEERIRELVEVMRRRASTLSEEAPGPSG